MTAEVRNNASGQLGAMTTTDTPVPPCANHCLRDGVTTLTIDRSFCFGMGCKGTTQCLNDKCGVLPEQTRVAYDEYESDLCPHGVGGEPDVVSGLGFRAGRDKIAKDARANLTTWQCDFDACGADESSISSEDYVDRSCKYFGGSGCDWQDWRDWRETSCRACYIGTPTSMNFSNNLGYHRCPMCVCEEFGKPADHCILCSGLYGYIKINLLRARGKFGDDPNAINGGAIHFGELKIFDSNGDLIEIDVLKSANPRGKNPPNQGPNGAVDGTRGLKFVDANFVANGMTSMIFAVEGEPDMIRGYEFFTANDAPSRDPVEWKFYGSRTADGPWLHFLHIKNADVPDSRFTSYGVYNPCASDAGGEPSEDDEKTFELESA